MFHSKNFLINSNQSLKPSQKYELELWFKDLNQITLNSKLWHIFEIEIWNSIRKLKSMILEFNEKEFEFHLRV
jgi:hypothetical protein